MSDVTSFKVTGDWRHIVDDGIVDTDDLPDEVLPTGHVTFTPLSPRVAVAGVPATAYTLGADTGLIAGGVLTDMQGRPGLSLAGKIGDTPVRWRAVVHLEYRGQKIDYPAVEFDLTEDVRLSGIIQQAGRLTPIVIDPRIEALAARLSDVDHVIADAEQIVADAGQSVVDAGLQADRARDEADRAIGLAGAQDEHIAGTLEDPASATHAAFKAVGNANYVPQSVLPTLATKDELGSVVPEGVVTSDHEIRFKLSQDANAPMADGEVLLVWQPPPLPSFYTDFSDGISGWTAGWVTTGTWTLVEDAAATGGHRLVAGGTGSRRLFRPTTPPTSEYANMEVLAKVRGDASPTTALSGGVALRGAGTGAAETGYAALVTSSELRLYRYINGGALMRSSAPFTITGAAWYWVRLRDHDGQIMAKAWADGMAEPAAWMVTDEASASIPAPGWAGVMAASNPGNQSFDQFAIAYGGDTAQVP